MPRNGSGGFTRVHDWTDDANAAIKIRADRMDEEDDGFAQGLTDSLCKDGQTTPTANLPMGGFRHTGVGAASARTQYVDVAGLQDGSYVWVDGGGTADAITATYSPALTALVDGQFCFVRATATNATKTPTFAPNGLTAHTITKYGGSALLPGDIAGDGHQLILRYELANTRWELLNPASPARTLNSVNVDLIDTAGGSLSTAYANGQTLDGASITTGMKIFRNIAAGDATNGFYTAPASGTASRSLDANTAALIPSGLLVSVTRGTAGAGTLWQHTTTPGFTLDTTALVFSERPKMDKGTFTPALTIGGGSTGITYSAQAGYYTKIGNRVYFDIVILLSNKGALTGNLSITGLPFTAQSTTPYLAPQSIYGSSLTSVTALMAAISASASSITIYNFTSSSAATLTNANIGNSSQFNISGVYSVS